MLLPEEELHAVPEEPYGAFAGPASTDKAPLPATLATHRVNLMTRPKILLVDDDENEIFLTRKKLEAQGCEVVSAVGVTDALTQIATQRFDVLVTDLHMPDPGDGFAVVTAMRHTQPEALTLVVSDYPDVQRAMNAILLQADEVLV